MMCSIFCEQRPLKFKITSRKLCQEIFSKDVNFLNESVLFEIFCFDN